MKDYKVHYVEPAQLERFLNEMAQQDFKCSQIVYQNTLTLIVVTEREAIPNTPLTSEQRTEIRKTIKERIKSERQ